MTSNAFNDTRLQNTFGLHCEKKTILKFTNYAATVLQ